MDELKYIIMLSIIIGLLFLVLGVPIFIIYLAVKTANKNKDYNKMLHEKEIKLKESD